ncbi:hypothetical protein Ddc_17948 [Ditylenchus destructor]|nr:hypothetical protein Ddc_17948 [Ditylenchus destructor]
MEPSAQKNRSENRGMNIATFDDDTTVEVFKYLNYCGLAKNSLVSKRFGNLICTHRHKLALLYVYSISIHKCTVNIRDPTGIKVFSEVLSHEAYNAWVIRNGYSKQIPLEIQFAGMQSTRYVYRLDADVDYYYKNCNPRTVLSANIKLSHENWPVFQHFFRLLTDPFVHIRHMTLPAHNDALNLVAGAINQSCGRRQCHLLSVSLQDNMQNLISWIKGHMRCYKIFIMNRNGSNYDEELLDFFMTGANCTSRIYVKFYDPCKVIGDFVQKFMDLKSCNGNKVLEFIECHPNANVNVDVLSRGYAKFVVKGDINENSNHTWHFFEFVNNDIGKKLKLTIRIDLRNRSTEFTLKVANL